MKILAICICMLSALSVFALDLDSARKQNLVQELPNGYLKVVDPKGKSVAETVNAKRKKHFESIAKKNNLSVEVVAKQAAEKIQKKLKGK